MQQDMPNMYPWQPRVLDKQERAKAPVDLLELAYLFLGHWCPIVLCLVLGAIVGFLYTIYARVQDKPEYEATAQVYVVPASSDFDEVVTLLSKLPSDGVLVDDVADVIEKLQNLPSDDSIIADYKALLLSEPLLQDVVDNLSLDVETEELEKKIDVTNLENTHIVQIDVTSENAQEAADVANELVLQGEIYFRDFVGTDTPKLLERAEVPVNRSNASSAGLLRNATVGGMIGAILCCGWLLARFLMNDTFVTPSDIVNYFGVQPLAVIPELHPDCEKYNCAREKKKGKAK